MGHVCGKPVKDKDENPKARKLAKRTAEMQGGRSTGNSKREDNNFGVQKKINNVEMKIQVVDKKEIGLKRVRDDFNVKNNEKFQVVKNNHHPGSGILPKAIEGEQIAAGWPSWLASSATEAVNGWLPRNADTFEKLDKIGQGTYSSVYKARDLTFDQVVAIKKVRFDSKDVESVKFMAREILILRRLDHPNVTKLVGLITSNTSSALYLVFEYMEHDLTGLASLTGSKFTEPQVKCYMKQLLSGLDHCHSRGVLHRDIKGSNLLIDNHGILKIADFGLASFFVHDQSVPLTSRVVTLWYRPPELLLGATHYGPGVDLWSTGCMLGELYTGKPILPGRTEVEQLHKIFKLCGSPSDDCWRQANLQQSTAFKPQQPYVRRLAETFKDLPFAAVGLLDTLLSIDPLLRGNAASALKSEFFSTEPFACDPASLPKYPPSKEIDAKLRNEEAKRQGGLGKSQRIERDFRESEDLESLPLPETTTKGQGESNPKARNTMFNLPKVENPPGFQFDTPPSSQVVMEARNGISGPLPRRTAYSGPLGPEAVFTITGKQFEDATFVSDRTDTSNSSGLVSSPTVPPQDQPGSSNQKIKAFHHRQQPVENTGAVHDIEPSERANNTAAPIVIVGRGGRKIHISGPILQPSTKVEQMLKEHERQIQEAARRARLDKARLSRVQSQDVQITPLRMHTKQSRMIDS